MIALVSSVLAASLVGSPHCAAMCGGFVCFYSASDPARRALAHIAYNGGRLLAYVALGAIAGALGAGIDRLGIAAGIGRAAAVVSGALMVLWGGAALLVALGASPAPAHRPGLLGPTARVLRGVRNRPPLVRALTLGLVTALLPCGWLYAFVATAAGTGHAWQGALVMAVFWTGTVPVLAGLGLAAQRAAGPLARRLPAVTASVLIVIGLLTVAGKFRPMMGARHHGAAGHACH